jgi:hypothetical protein
MNKAIVGLCKEPPLKYFAFSKAYMLANQALDLFQSKTRTIRHIAENIVRYMLLLFLLSSYQCILMSSFIVQAYDSRQGGFRFHAYLHDTQRDGRLGLC